MLLDRKQRIVNQHTIGDKMPGVIDKRKPPPKFHALHYNFVAKRLREAFDMSDPDKFSAVARTIRLANHAVISDLSMAFARKFMEDNPKFDPLKFLDACSPDPELYPFSELWENDWTPQDGC